MWKLVCIFCIIQSALCFCFERWNWKFGGGGGGGGGGGNPVILKTKNKQKKNLVYDSDYKWEAGLNNWHLRLCRFISSFEICYEQIWEIFGLTIHFRITLLCKATVAIDFYLKVSCILFKFLE